MVERTVGIVGHGRMGRALGQVLAAAGIPVRVCGRPDRGAATPVVPGCRTANLEDIMRDESIVLLAVPFPTALTLASGVFGRVGGGRTLVDLTNPDMGSGGALRGDRGGGELIAAAARSWRVAKAFNTVSADLLSHRTITHEPISLPVATDHPAARRDVFAIARTLGFQPVDAGGIRNSRHLESLAVLLRTVSNRHRLRGRVTIHIGTAAPTLTGPARSGAANDQAG